MLFYPLTGILVTRQNLRMVVDSMPFDGMFTHAMTKELNTALVGGRISKIHEPFQNEVVLTVRSNRKNVPVLLSAHPNYARVQITTGNNQNPPTPTNFVMSLRKHLDGAILNDITQYTNDRIIRFHFNHRNDIGDQEILILAIEIMGRRSNIVLYEEKSGRIIDTIKHISSDQNRYRLLMPGAQYITPPDQGKVDPFSSEAEQQLSDLQSQFPNYEVLAQEILNKFQGFSKDSSLELAYRLINRPDSNTFKDYLDEYNHPNPTLFIDQKNKMHFSSTANSAFETVKSNSFGSLSELLDSFYADKANHDRVQQISKNLIRVVKNELKKNINKKKKLQKTLDNTEHADEYRIKGEILTTYLSQINRSMTEVVLDNFYDDNKPIKIALSNQLSPSQNAQKYFKRYQKEKNAVIFVGEQLDLTNQEIMFLENIETQIELAKPEDMSEIETELMEQGYMKPVNNKKKVAKNKKKITSKPEHYKTSESTDVLVGKNDRQNDQLTMKTAKKNDYWFHTKDIPGSHVIIQSDNPSDQDILEAATIAAYFSKAQNSSNVPVDYVRVKNIRKPNGSKPGFVIYEGQHTIRVNPDAELVNKLRQ